MFLRNVALRASSRPCLPLRKPITSITLPFYIHYSYDSGIVLTACITRRFLQSDNRFSSLETIPLSFPAFTIWAPSTDIGKTAVSAALCFTGLQQSTTHKRTSNNSLKIKYIKPVQTGWCSSTKQGTSDELLVKNICINFQNNLYSNTIISFKAPCSPNLARTMERRDDDLSTTDSAILKAIIADLWQFSSQCSGDHAMCLIETAGGIATPFPSNTLQCDVLRTLRLPCILVGDGRLGGISTTIAAYESLKSRGYDIPVLLIIDSYDISSNMLLQNYNSIVHYFKNKNDTKLFYLPPLPESSIPLCSYIADTHTTWSTVLSYLFSWHQQRLHALNSLSKSSQEMLWWPFTQHATLVTKAVSTIDARIGETFAIYNNEACSIERHYDGCNSWWTQGIGDAGRRDLLQAMSYTAGRYGHIMFPQNVHEPAMNAAQALLRGPGQGWARRVFYSDDGSTAMEIALKMAFRLYSFNQNLKQRNLVNNKQNILNYYIIGQQGAYHGDTLGTMNAVADSIYNSVSQHPWRRGLGLFLQPPSVAIVKGEWTITLPTMFLAQIPCTNSASDNKKDHCNSDSGKALNDMIIKFSNRHQIFSLNRENSLEAALYKTYILNEIQQYKHRNPSHILAALVLEPVLMGAGGMIMIDPLFQRILVNICRDNGMSIVFDEVFTGCWRLGAITGAALLHTNPDIACYGKLITGGAISLAATLTTSAVYDAYLSSNKTDALLHGHSYTANPIGCAAVATALSLYTSSSINCNYNLSQHCMHEYWQFSMLSTLSNIPGVERVVAMGSVLACELHHININDLNYSSSNSTNRKVDYSSNVASTIVEQLRLHGIYCRPLGNVIYIMVGVTTYPEQCQLLVSTLIHVLQKFNGVISTKSTVIV